MNNCRKGGDLVSLLLLFFFSKCQRVVSSYLPQFHLAQVSVLREREMNEREAFCDSLSEDAFGTKQHGQNRNRDLEDGHKDAPIFQKRDWRICLA